MLYQEPDFCGFQLNFSTTVECITIKFGTNLMSHSYWIAKYLNPNDTWLERFWLAVPTTEVK